VTEIPLKLSFESFKTDRVFLISYFEAVLPKLRFTLLALSKPFPMFQQLFEEKTPIMNSEL